ncbi:trypsin-like serine protease [Hymenobacter cellulosilyticus]|uniref:Trypsin-like serine protease n=1 Tax=Hymenobacter cellulosilyticus TaxID=2932248 RepID=A0A8T9QF48_9BACT|nr:trypsin-like serine protease [Hymenobacter cellulosilyticus]UOQ73463.1 trypsin-like serine protease [Hymenobacter cellulosilyticus]
MKTLRLLFLMLVGLMLAPVAWAQDQKPDIVGGAPTTIDQVPWQVLMTINGLDGCGGSIIGSRWILTAAHCVANKSPNDLRIYAGLTFRNQKGSGQMYTIEQILVHPNYNAGTHDNDVALLLLSSPISTSANAQIISYATSSTVSAGLTNPGVNATVSGWGRLSSGGSQPDQLYSVNLPIASNATANSQYNPSGFTITNGMLAAGLPQGGVDACQGDSGGPLIVRNSSGTPILAGVVSWGFGCADPRYLGIYARVSEYAPWIANTLANPPSWTPCGSNVICDNQCVAYGAVPARIKGRVLADENSAEFQAYAAAVGSGKFAEGSEKEWAQWQYSYDNVNFYNIDGNATGKDFQPWDCYATTYYRRVSTHRIYNTFSSPRQYWYTSNVVTITPSSPPPTPTQSTYYVCGGGTFNISFTPGAAATSSNWSLPNLGWTVNGGQGVIYQSSYNVGSTTTVTISVPANVTPGAYEIHTSSNGPCGSSGYRSITVVVGQAANSTVTGNQTVFFNSSQRYTVSGNNSNYNWTVPYGWSITGGQGSSSITVRTPDYETYDPVEVTFNDACGNPSSAMLYVDNLPRTPCRYCEPIRAAGDDKQGIYPNPAVDEVTIASEGQEAEATFYDARGKARKVVQLHADASLNKVSVRDLPDGLYHVRVVGNGMKTVDRQLVIQH